MCHAFQAHVACINRAARHLCHTVLSRDGMVYDVEIALLHVHSFVIYPLPLGEGRVRVSGFAPIETLTRRALRVGLSQRERRFPHPAPGQADRFKNWLISRTTAEVPVHVMD